ncbi:MAG TPA: aldehyde ferredoxin oxidoreductase C-terminal domain-containing protein [Spirochaetota bacterium]|jgi:aldehyde:ferredoxin oxidoreductase|nr:MAG: putative oxidoreductase YdhV [Spirochaetes bacterium ADurb.Bin218]HOK01038.1 aldehyde ferredoxin oxidoreductase C-terminal domain-containing protein [Spirochaetota bacterium]HOK91486.1 aldehyde ferredoxin oxidoreductase C-terminal domain-containing protein [Spirochaetota bacterium]HON14905.1 aldehyde ferredoxin oxidoreductase C-terminal domain-containing protein [Spirochaetota bacterium]HOV09425.1 aldehyde ferredoxin oxidoreductase C-terminal domain-containing protein [Spirochaetota bac
MDKILRIDMGAPGGPKVKVDGLGSYAGLGGRALTSMIVATEVDPMANPLGAENKLVIAPGLLSGTAAAMSGRISIGCKSPLTGGIKEANAGGQPAQVLARLGYAAIVLEGNAPEGKLYKVYINKEGVKIEPADDYKMLPNYDLIDKIKASYGDKVACISIGPAGEMKLSAASIACTDMEFRPTRHAGRGGVGAVMGAKGVKVIILDDSGLQNREPKDPEKFREANKKWVDGLRSHSVTGTALPTYGTNVLSNIINESGGFPTRNFKEGKFEGVSAISGETFADIETKRGGNPTHGCHRGCVIRCSGIYVDKNGNYLTKQPEYETVWAHGANCGIDDPDTIAMLDYLDDNYGLDTIDMGAAIGVAMEAGIIPFGDKEGAINLIKEVGKGSYLGRIIGSGAAVTAKVFGVERAPVVKGQAMPAYDPRAIQGIGVTYATSTMGADHTAGYCIATNILKVGGFVDPLKPEGQVELSRNLQIATAAVDSTGMCLFIAFAILDQPETFQALIDMINAFYGLNLDADGVADLGKKVLKAERDFNKKAGFTAAHDRLPKYFYTEKLPPHNVVFQVTDEELDSVFNF